MPITKNGVTMQDSLLEAATIGGVEHATFDCFSLAHPAGTTIYFVNNYDPFTALLEDGTTEVEFLACPISMKRPDESDQSGSPQINIQVANISGAVSDKLNAIRGDLRPWILTNYIYASNDPSGPLVTPPDTMEIDNVSTDAQLAVLTGTLGDPGNQAVPALTFLRKLYPGLIR